MSKANVTIEHSWFGCETGCCGHRVRVSAPADVPDELLPKTYGGGHLREAEQFFFEHPWEATKDEFVEELVRMTLDYHGVAADIIEACGGHEVESAEIMND